MKKRMKKDANWLAQRVAKLEGKKEQLTIAQIKEVLKCLKDLCEADDDAVHSMFKYVIPKCYLIVS